MSYSYVGHRAQFSGFRGLGVDSAAYNAGKKCVETATKNLKFDEDTVKNCMAAYNAAAATAACTAVTAGAAAAVSPLCGEIAAAATAFLFDTCYPALESIFGGLFGAGDAERRKARTALLKKITNAEQQLATAQAMVFKEWSLTVDSLGIFYDKLVGGGGEKAAAARIKALGAEPTNWETMYKSALDARKLTAVLLNPGLTAEQSYGKTAAKGSVNVFCKNGWAGVNSGNYSKMGCVVDNDPLKHNAARKLEYIAARIADINACFTGLRVAAALFVAETTGQATALKIAYRIAHPNEAAASDAAAAQAKARSDSAKQGYADRAAQAYEDAQKKAKADAKKKAADEKKAQAARDKAVADQSVVYQRQQAAARNAELLRMIFSGGTLGLLWRRRG